MSRSTPVFFLALALIAAAILGVQLLFQLTKPYSSLLTLGAGIALGTAAIVRSIIAHRRYRQAMAEAAEDTEQA